MAFFDFNPLKAVCWPCVGTANPRDGEFGDRPLDERAMAAEAHAEESLPLDIYDQQIARAGLNVTSPPGGAFMEVSPVGRTPESSTTSPGLMKALRPVLPVSAAAEGGEASSTSGRLKALPATLPRAGASQGGEASITSGILKVPTNPSEARSNTGFRPLNGENDAGVRSKSVVFAGNRSKSPNASRSGALPESSNRLGASLPVSDGTQSEMTFMSGASDWSEDNRVGECSAPTKTTSMSILMKLSNSMVKVVSDDSESRMGVEMSEKQWRQRHKSWECETVRSGSRLLLVACCCFGVARCVDLIIRTSSSETCSMMGSRSAGEVAVSLALEWCCYLAIACLSLHGLMRPNVIIHYIGMLFLLVFTAGFPMLPIEPTCQELVSYQLCRGDSEMSWRSGNEGCGPQGTQPMITTLLTVCMAPYIMERMRETMIFVSLNIAAYVTISSIHLYTSDLPHYNEMDVLACVLVLLLAAGLSAYRKHIISRKQAVTRRKALRNEFAAKKMLDLLQDYLPDHVITPMLTNPSAAIAEQIPIASVLFLVISDFEAHLSRRTPVQLLDFLNTLFARIDRICVDAHVTKIETVGEEYVAAVGVKPDDYALAKDNYEMVLGKLLVSAMMIFNIQDEQAERNDPGDPLHGVRFRMGVHTGPVVAGVIGQKLPRFRLFGDTINTAARMMQKGVDGELQFGEETKNHLPAWAASDSRGTVEMKGKGSVHVYLLDRKHGNAQDAWEEHRSFAHRKTGRNSLDNIISQTLSEDNLRYTTSMGSMMSTQIRSGCSWCWHNVGSKAARFVCDNGRPEQKRAWLREYYQARIVSRMGARHIRQMVVLLTGTTVEAVAAVVLDASSPGDGNGGGLAVFFVLRAALLLPILFWLYAARDKQRFTEMPRVLEMVRLAHVYFQTLLQILAYSLLIGPGTLDASSELTIAAIQEEAEKEALRVPLWNFVFLLWFAVTILDLRLRTKTTLAFVVLCVLSLLVLPAFAPVTRRLCSNNVVVGALVMGAVGVEIARSDQAQDKRRFEMETQVARASARIDSILSMLMPPLVAAHVSSRASRISASMAVKQQQHASAYKKATIACSDLVGFTKIASTRTPVEVVEMVSDLFARFDDLSDHYLIYKIETVGDAYIAGQALRPLTAIYRPLSVVVFGFEMVGVVRKWSKEKNVPVDARVGVHTGECVGGVVGVEMKRYHLFGSLLAGVESLESTAPTGQVHLSRACETALSQQLSEERLSDQIVVYSARTELQLHTSKGDPVAYEEVGGGPTFVVQSCRPELYDPHPDGTSPASAQQSQRLPDQVSEASSVEESRQEPQEEQRSITSPQLSTQPLVLR